MSYVILATSPTTPDLIAGTYRNVEATHADAGQLQRLGFFTEVVKLTPPAKIPQG